MTRPRVSSGNLVLISPGLVLNNKTRRSRFEVTPDIKNNFYKKNWIEIQTTIVSVISFQGYTQKCIQLFLKKTLHVEIRYYKREPQYIDIIYDVQV